MWYKPVNFWSKKTVNPTQAELDGQNLNNEPGTLIPDVSADLNAQIRKACRIGTRNPKPEYRNPNAKIET